MLSVFLAVLDTKEEQDGFLSAYNNFRAPLIGYALKYVHDMSDAEDIVHDVFQIAVVYWKKIAQRGTLGIKRFLFICVRNRALNMLESRSRLISLEALEESGSVIPSDSIEDSFLDAIADAETLEKAKLIINTLDEKTADTFLMFLAEYSVEDIAKFFDEKPETIRKRLYRAKLRLRNALDAKGGDAR